MKLRTKIEDILYELMLKDEIGDVENHDRQWVSDKAITVILSAVREAMPTTVDACHWRSIKEQKAYFGAVSDIIKLLE